MIRWQWTPSPGGNWVCQSGSHCAVVEWMRRERWWELRIKTPSGGISTTHLRPASPSALQQAVEDAILAIARQSATVHLFDYEPLPEAFGGNRWRERDAR